MGNRLRQTVHTHRASVHQAAKLVAALLRVVGVTAGLAESNGSLLPGLWLTSPAGWLPRTGSRTLCSVIEYGLPVSWQTNAMKYIKQLTRVESKPRLFLSNRQRFCPDIWVFCRTMPGFIANCFLISWYLNIWIFCWTCCCNRICSHYSIELIIHSVKQTVTKSIKHFT